MTALRENGTDNNPQGKPSPRSAWVAGLFLLLFVVQGASFVTGKSVTYDEAPHIAAGLSAWRTGDFRIFNTNPPLVRMIATVPLLAMDVPLPRERGWDLSFGIVLINEIADAYHKPFHHLVMAARWLVLAMTSLLGVLVWLDARKRFGEPAGLCAAALFATQPMLVAYGSILMVDAGAAFFMYLAVRTFIGFQEKGWNWTRALVMGLALGAALSSKFTNVSLLASLPLLTLLATGNPDRPIAGPLKSAGFAAAALLVALVALNACYGFQGTFQRLDAYELKSRPLAFAQRLLPGAVPVPLPLHLVAGFDRQSVMNEETGGANALTIKNGGWFKGRRPFIFFHYGATKLTLPLIILSLGAMAILARRALSADGRRRIVLWPAACIVVSTVHFCLIAFVAANYYSFRYLLGIVPFLILLAGFAVRELFLLAPGKWKAGVTIPALVALTSLGGAALAYPDYLAYTNALIWGDERGFRHDPDNCRDWGQDLIALKEWRDLNPSGTLYLAYFGSIDPAHYGLDWQVPPPQPAPGIWAISLTNLRSGEAAFYCLRNNAIQKFPSPGPYFGWLKGRKPDAKVGEIYIFDIGE